jgi:uncharacterized membrane protein YfcA
MTAADLLPNDISSGALIRLAIVALVSSVTRGFSGFGAALIFMPLAGTVAPPRIVAALLLIIDFVASAQMVPNAWKLAQRGNVAVMALGASVGVPIGTWALTRLDPLITRWIIASLVLALLVLLISGWRYHGKPHPALTAAVGGVSGLCSGVAQTGGPPIVTYWLGQPLPSIVARANIVLFFAFSDSVSMVSYLVSGLLTTDVAKLALIIGPIYFAGLFLGARMFGVASETLFRRVCYGLIAVAGVIGLPLMDRFTH